MFTLVAASRKPILDGIISKKTFDTLEEAETVMRQWARFGVDNCCNTADALYICDSRAKLVRTWSRAKKKSMAPA